MMERSVESDYSGLVVDGSLDDPKAKGDGEAGRKFDKAVGGFAISSGRQEAVGPISPGSQQLKILPCKKGTTILRCGDNNEEVSKDGGSDAYQFKCH